MNLPTLVRKVNLALADLGSKDLHLLEKDLHERTIAHQFALYLGRRFRNHQVDCEYNGNVASEGGRKILYEIKHHLQKPNRRILDESIRSGNEDQAEPIRVFPDIIVHCRGDNDHNLLAIEIKKSSNTRHQEFDKKKLKAFTSDRCEFKYDFGLFLEIGVGGRSLTNRLEWYENGLALSPLPPQ